MPSREEDVCNWFHMLVCLSSVYSFQEMKNQLRQDMVQFKGVISCSYRNLE